MGRTVLSRTSHRPLLKMIPTDFIVDVLGIALIATLLSTMIVSGTGIVRLRRNPRPIRAQR